MTCAGMMLAEAPSTTIHQAIAHISIERRKMNSTINEIDKFATKTVNESHTIQPGSPLFILFRLFASIPVLFCCLFFGFLYLATLSDFSFCALNNFEAHQTTLLRKKRLEQTIVSLRSLTSPVDDSKFAWCLIYISPRQQQIIFGQFRAV